jgi:hypothetical protein
VAIYHLSCKIIGRSAGRSAVAAAAYRAGVSIENTFDGEVHDYSQKGGVVYSKIFLPENAPPEYADRATLWNAVENAEKSVNAQLAREIEIALPAELTLSEQIKLAEDYVKRNFVSQGMCADIAVHDKRDGNPHAHIMLTMRPMTARGTWEQKFEKIYLCKNKDGEEREFTADELAAAGGEVVWEKQLPYYLDGDVKNKPLYLTKSEAEKEEYKAYSRVKGKKDPKKLRQDRANATTKLWDSPDSLEFWRANWAKSCNDIFDELHISERIDHRSYERQGIDKEPTVHLGPAATRMKKEKIASDRQRINDEIREANEMTEEYKALREAAQEEIDRLRSEIVARTYGINLSVRYDDRMQFDTTVAGRLAEEWAIFVKADMELDGCITAAARVADYRRKAAALRETGSDYAKVSKQIKSLRDRLAKTAVVKAGERKRLTGEITALTEKRKSIAAALLNEYDITPQLLSAQLKNYEKIASGLEANILAGASEDERQKQAEDSLSAFAEHFAAVAKLPAATEIFGLYGTATDRYREKILAQKHPHYNTEQMFTDAAAKAERAVANVRIGANGGGGVLRGAVKLNLIVDLRSNLKTQGSRGYERWAKLHNLKQMAQTLIFLEENNLASYDKLTERADGATKEYTDVRAQIAAAEQRLKDNAAMQNHLRAYARTRAVYDGYKKSGYSKKYKQEHERDILQHQESKKFFGGFDKSAGKPPKIADLREEYAAVLAEKKSLYPRYTDLKAKSHDVITAKRNIDAYLGVREELEREATRGKRETR